MQIILLLILTIAVLIFIFGTWRALKMSRKSVALIEKYENDKKNPALIQEIFDTLRADYRLNKILPRKLNRKRRTQCKLFYF